MTLLLGKATLEAGGSWCHSSGGDGRLSRTPAAVQRQERQLHSESYQGLARSTPISSLPNACNCYADKPQFPQAGNRNISTGGPGERWHRSCPGGWLCCLDAGLLVNWFIKVDRWREADSLKSKNI